jgi:hypothetical protein
MKMSLADWQKDAWLVDHKTSPREIAELLAIANRDLDECQAAGLSPDWRLAIAFNAALQTATAALAACGYRAAREGHHYRIIQSLAFTVGADASLIALFDGFRKKRNISDYERVGAVSIQEAGEMLALAKSLRQRVGEWLRNNHPELLEE